MQSKQSTKLPEIGEFKYRKGLLEINGGWVKAYNTGSSRTIFYYKNYVIKVERCGGLCQCESEYSFYKSLTKHYRKYFPKVYVLGAVNKRYNYTISEKIKIDRRRKFTNRHKKLAELVCSRLAIYDVADRIIDLDSNQDLDSNSAIDINGKFWIIDTGCAVWGEYE